MQIEHRVNHYTFNGNRALSVDCLIEGDHSAKWKVEHASSSESQKKTNFCYRFTALQRSDCSNLGVSLALPDWTVENYVMAPSGVYDGNRFPSKKMPYPPILAGEERKIAYDAPIITDVPRLDVECGESLVQFVSGDLSVPAICVFYPLAGKSVYVIAKRDSSYGLDVKESAGAKSCEIVISAPCVKQERQFRFSNWGSESQYAGADFEIGDSIEIEFDVIIEETPSLSDFYAKWFDLWYDYSSASVLEDTFPLSAAWELYESHLNRWQWSEKGEYYRVGIDSGDSSNPWNKYQDFQPGWVGGGINTFPALLAGTEESKTRAMRTIEFLTTKGQLEGGFYSSIVENGEGHFGDDFHKIDDQDFHLARKSADVICYLMREITLLSKREQEVPASWETSIKRACDAFAKLWQEYGQFGQFVGALSGEIKVGGSSSAVSAIGGIAWAGKFFNDQEWLNVAKEAGEYYYKNYLSRGMTNGGPGEILQSPDSESAYAFVESYMALYEVTGDPKWLRYCEEATWQYSSWVMNYDFDFPAESQFGRHALRSAGSVFANVQNKHSSPGICTFSGDAIFKLYRATGNMKYLKLIQLTVHNITQYFSREDQTFYARNDKTKALYPGMMNERVSTSDFEGREFVGEVFFGQCWSSISAALSFVELPGVYVNLDDGEVSVFDHVTAGYQDGSLTITNPTSFSAKVLVLAETEADRKLTLGLASALHWTAVEVAAGSTEMLQLRSASNP